MCLPRQHLPYLSTCGQALRSRQAAAASSIIEAMSQIQNARHVQPPPASRDITRIGCVSFLNARPLIDGLAPEEASVTLDVPSRLLEGLESGRLDVALCPVIDFYRSSVPLAIVPSGGISCEGPTLTVRLYSRVRPERINQVHVDADSHTSVVLLQVLLERRWGRRPRIVTFDAASTEPDCQAMLLIGDKVVTSPPAASLMPHQVDLGEAWHEMTGLPFVFAAWMCRRGAKLGRIPQHLDRLRRTNAGRIAELATREASTRGWPIELAHRYLGSLLQYELTPRHLEAIECFARMASRIGLLRNPSSLHVVG